LCLSKYTAVYVWTYAGLCHALRRHVRLRLYRDLCRDLYREPYPALNHASFQKPFEKPNPTLFYWLHGLKHPQLYDLVNPVRYRET
jgi:hypothetical protein